MFFTIFVRVLLSRRLDFELFNFSKFRDFPQLPIPIFYFLQGNYKIPIANKNDKFKIFDGFFGSLFCPLFFSKASCSSWHQSASFDAEFHHLFSSVLAQPWPTRDSSPVSWITILELNRLNFRKSPDSCPQLDDISKIWPSSRFGLAMAGFGRDWTGFWLKRKHKLILIFTSEKE